MLVTSDLRLGDNSLNRVTSLLHREGCVLPNGQVLVCPSFNLLYLCADDLYVNLFSDNVDSDENRSIIRPSTWPSLRKRTVRCVVPQRNLTQSVARGITQPSH